MRRLEYVDDWGRLARESRYDANALATICCISISQLRRWFQEVGRSTPQDWLNELRLWHALRMVCTGTPTKVVAVELNFGTPSLFCRHFLRYFKCTPTNSIALHHRNLKCALAEQLQKEGLHEPWKRAEQILVARLRPRKLASREGGGNLVAPQNGGFEESFQ